MNSTKKRHSKVLIWLFLTEMWERFSYYGMRAILVLYLVTAISEGGLGWSEMASGQLYGIYTGLVYLTPLIGGYIADKYWGFKSSIIVGGILMALGHGALAINSDYAFFAGLSLLIIGNGFFKPNISSLVGEIYSKNEDLKALKDSAFTIFYMGINLGAFLGTLVCGYLAQAYGWHYGFGAAGIGMIVGLIVFSLTKHHIQEPVKNSSQQQIERAKPLTSIEKDKLLVIFILAFFQITFWLAYEQAGSSVNLFTHTYVNKIIELPNIIGSWFIQADAMGKYMFDIPTAWFQAINAFLIIVLGLPFSALWKWLAIKNKNPSSPTKFALGLIFLSIGFMVLIVGATGVAKGHVHWCWLVFMYLLHTVGELCLSPVGLSMVTKMAPVKLAGTMMGVWFLAIAIANYIGGALSGYMQEISKASSISNFFMIFVTIPMVAAVVLLVFSKKLTKLMHDTE
ncbi:MAG: hypothetical protein RL060_1461 [Bacteroidota bacterium]